MKRPGLWVIPLLALVSAPAGAETRRVAVVVGNDAGGAERQPLRYAETDAAKVARVFLELGGVGKGDLFLLRGRGLHALEDTLARARQRVVFYHQTPGDRVVLLFYFSGHSDGIALELGGDRLAFSELRRWLGSTGAEVRIAVVDSCKSGGLLAAKGGSRGPAFQIRLTEELASSGEALLTSSAADEIALESREIGGSFFTHHLLSGLRGAADASGDGMVSLSEAYEYAHSHTIRATGETLAGPQHPVYDYRLSGQGDLVLTELSRPSAMIELPKGYERAMVLDGSRRQVIAELTSDGRARIAVRPGRYLVRLWRSGRGYAGRIAVSSGGRRLVGWDELVAMPVVSAQRKGGRESAGSSLAILVAAGGQRGVASELGPVPGVRVGARSPGPTGPSLAMTLGSGRGIGFRETSALLFAGYRLGIERGRFRAWGVLEAGGGLVVQSIDGRSSASSAALAVAPGAGASVDLTRPFALVLEAALPAVLLRRDDRTAVTPLPGLWLGLQFEN
jgi:hypothetical protein